VPVMKRNENEQVIVPVGPTRAAGSKLTGLVAQIAVVAREHDRLGNSVLRAPMALRRNGHRDGRKEIWGTETPSISCSRVYSRLEYSRLLLCARRKESEWVSHFPKAAI